MRARLRIVGRSACGSPTPGSGSRSVSATTRAWSAMPRWDWAEIRTFCDLQRRPLGLLRMAVSRLGLSPRAFHRVLRLSRTIADLAGSGEIGEVHVAEAISYRLLDRGVGSPVS